MNSMHFFTGKGGVGKTFLCLREALAHPSAISSEFRAGGLAAEAQKQKLKLPRIQNFPRAELTEDFLARALKIKPLAHFLSQSRLFQSLVGLAPHLDEILLLKRWLHLASENTVYIDAPSTGHFIALFRAVKAAQELFDGGLLHKLATEMSEELLSHSEIHIWIVSLPENSSLSESREIDQFLREYYPSFQTHHLLNRLHSVPPPDFEEPWLSFGNQRAQLEAERQVLFEKEGNEFSRVQEEVV